MAAPVVPYVLPKGRAVIAYKRAYSRAGYYQWGEFTKVWGDFIERACRNFQHEAGLPVTGKHNEATHKALVKAHRRIAPTEWAFDPWSIAILKDEAISPEQEVMYKILDGVTWSIDHEFLLGYKMYRPFPVYPTFPVNHKWYNDCSGMFSQWYKWGGAPDPHGNDFDGIGNTATLWSHGEKVSSLSQATYCDAVLYGTPWSTGSSAHVVLLRRKAGSVWYAGSHGKESGPNEVRADYREVVGIRRFPLVKG